ncbi:MAG: RNA polymerase subunit sigma-24 [Alphaproteobacteria bacterium]|nr:MAG: RNA polymerase subunit sigma-24 [Alphaproteobacteria bacterium]
MTSPPAEREDGALAAAALAGEERAFTELMRRHKDAVYRLARRYVGDADEALDLVQETFASAWSALADYDPGRPMSAWLRRIVLNKCRDWSRRRQVRRFFFGAASIDTKRAETIAAAQTAPDPAVEGALTRLEAAIAALPVSLKEPLLLTTIEELSHKEAGRLLGLSPKAVEMRVYRAKQALAQTMDNEGHLTANEPDNS